MKELKTIPVFPLNILPLPGELVPLHIFEQRYRDLLSDVEQNDITFGIFYAHPDNSSRLGALVRLESLIKRYETGESDIVVKGVDTFILSKFYDKLSDKLYPGGEVFLLNSMEDIEVSENLRKEFGEYMKLRNIKLDDTKYHIHDIANELDLSTADRIRYLKLLTNDKRQHFIQDRLMFRRKVLEREFISKDTFHLN